MTNEWRQFIRGMKRTEAGEIKEQTIFANTTFATTIGMAISPTVLKTKTPNIPVKIKGPHVFAHDPEYLQAREKIEEISSDVNALYALTYNAHKHEQTLGELYHKLKFRTLTDYSTLLRPLAEYFSYIWWFTSQIRVIAPLAVKKIIEKKTDLDDRKKQELFLKVLTSTKKTYFVDLAEQITKENLKTLREKHSYLKMTIPGNFKAENIPNFQIKLTKDPFKDFSLEPSFKKELEKWNFIFSIMQDHLEKKDYYKIPRYENKSDLVNYLEENMIKTLDNLLTIEEKIWR